MISRFNQEFKFLSNFQASTLVYEGKFYRSVEHAYQAAKCTDPDEAEAIRDAGSASMAKRLGKAAKMRPDWEEVKVSIMEDLLRRKFQNPFLRHKLLATGNAVLIEGNTWGDIFWGVCGGEGLNMLGKLLMSIRDEIRVEEAGVTH